MNCMSREEFNQLEVGDIVTIREFKDLCEEYGDFYEGMPNVPLGFNSIMVKSCGKEAVVRGVVLDHRYRAVKLENNRFDWGKEMLKPGHRSPVSFEDIQNEWNNLMFGES